MYAAYAYLPFPTAYQSRQLNGLFRRAVRTVCRVPPGTPTSNILTRMNIQTLTTYANMHLLVFIWRCLHDSSNISMLFANFFSRSNSTQTRCGHSNLLIVPASPTGYLAKRVTYAGTILWNLLPAVVRQERKRNRFKSMALAFFAYQINKPLYKCCMHCSFHYVLIMKVTTPVLSCFSSLFFFPY